MTLSSFSKTKAPLNVTSSKYRVRPNSFRVLTAARVLTVLMYAHSIKSHPPPLRFYSPAVCVRAVWSLPCTCKTGPCKWDARRATIPTGPGADFSQRRVHCTVEARCCCCREDCVHQVRPVVCALITSSVAIISGDAVFTSPLPAPTSAPEPILAYVAHSLLHCHGARCTECLLPR